MSYSIYVGCGLKHAPASFKAKVQEMKKMLCEKGFEVTEFVSDPDATDEQVYENDILTMVSNCDFVIAVLDHPSTGLGLELGAALFRYNKPVLGLARDPEQVSRLIRGIKAEFDENMFKLEKCTNLMWMNDRILPDFLRGLEATFW